MNLETSAETQRIDQWLWHSRLIKSRSLAQRLIEAGTVRVNRAKIAKPGYQIRPGDVVTFMYADNLHVVKVKATAKRRGPAGEAGQLYDIALQNGCEQSTLGDEKEGA